MFLKCSNKIIHINGTKRSGKTNLVLSIYSEIKHKYYDNYLYYFSPDGVYMHHYGAFNAFVQFIKFIDCKCTIILDDFDSKYKMFRNELVDLCLFAKKVDNITDSKIKTRVVKTQNIQNTLLTAFW